MSGPILDITGDHNVHCTEDHVGTTCRDRLGHGACTYQTGMELGTLRFTIIVRVRFGFIHDTMIAPNCPSVRWIQYCVKIFLQNRKKPAWRIPKMVSTFPAPRRTVGRARPFAKWKNSKRSNVARARRQSLRVEENYFSSELWLKCIFPA